jgi:hypothetical protein
MAEPIRHSFYLRSCFTRVWWKELTSNLAFYASASSNLNVMNMAFVDVSQFQLPKLYHFGLLQSRDSIQTNKRTARLLEHFSIDQPNF